MKKIIKIDNHGPLITSSNFWGSDLDRAGKYYLSINAGAFRLLCPKGKGSDLSEMRTGKNIAVTIGKVIATPMPGMVMEIDMVELLFDDNTEDPFALWLAVESVDRLPAAEDYNRLWELSVWEGRKGSGHKVLSRPCYLRKGDLPCLKPANKK